MATSKRPPLTAETLAAAGGSVRPVASFFFGGPAVDGLSWDGL